jgi:hypothetical protein
MLNSDNDNILEILMKPFPDDELEYVPGRGGKVFSYPPVDKAILRAIEAWGQQWSFVIEKSWIENGYALIQGYIQDPAGNRRSSVAGKIIETYSKDVTNKKGEVLHKSGEIIDLSDDFKGAASYCLRKCLWEFGVGLYLSDKNGRVMQRKHAEDRYITEEAREHFFETWSEMDLEPERLEALIEKTVGKKDRSSFTASDWLKLSAKIRVYKKKMKNKEAA